MTDYPYSTNPASLKKFLKMIPSIGIPDAVTTRWLPSVGLKSKNDRTILPVLKFVGLLDDSGKPTKLWKEFRHSERGPPALGAQIRRAYGPLFQTFPDADRKDAEALTNFFKAGTSLGERAIQYSVQTFKALCESAELEGVNPAESETETESVDAENLSSQRPGRKGGLVLTPKLNPQAPTIAINIQIQIPAIDNADVYEKFFAAMRKHLIDEKTD